MVSAAQSAACIRRFTRRCRSPIRTGNVCRRLSRQRISFANSIKSHLQLLQLRFDVGDAVVLAPSPPSRAVVNRAAVLVADAQRIVAEPEHATAMLNAIEFAAIASIAARPYITVTISMPHVGAQRTVDADRVVRLDVVDCGRNCSGLRFDRAHLQRHLDLHQQRPLERIGRVQQRKTFTV